MADSLTSLPFNADDIVDTVRQPMLVLNADLRVRRVNWSFCQTFRVTSEQLLDRLVYDLDNRSLHEMARLREEFGDDYDAYLNSGIPFYLPVPERSGLKLTSAVANLEGHRKGSCGVRLHARLQDHRLPPTTGPVPGRHGRARRAVGPAVQVRDSAALEIQNCR